MLKKPRFFFSCMVIVLATSLFHEGILFAQQGAMQIPAEQIPAGAQQQIEALTTAQRRAVESELSKTGGQITPEAIETLKKSPEFQGVKPGDAVETEKQKTASEKPAADQGEAGQELMAMAQVEEYEPEALRRFGLNYFRPARQRIRMIENMLRLGQRPAVGERDALTGFVGPLDMVSSYVNASIPAQYALNPGDKVIIYFWGDLLELTEQTLTLDSKGEVSIPKVGRIIARGMTLSQFQDAVKDQLQRIYGKNIRLIASLDSLKSIQIFITGESYRPGSYAVSAVTTLFNALYASGGPSGYGSLREIKLLRNNKTINIDFYNYLLKGESREDYPLQAGDTIFISKVGKLVSIEGEVNRPGRFELKGDERLKDLVSLANGIKPTGLLQKVQIQSVIPNRARVVLDVDISKGAPAQNQELFDGDSIVISSVLPDIVNSVTVEGKVERPGIYELKKEMRVSDLFTEINRPLGESYMERADILRLNRDRKTTTMIPINLARALDKDAAHDLKLYPMDKLVVYSKWDVKFIPARKISVSGSVQNPGEFERSDGMRVQDLLIMAGGILPNTHLERADLMRYNFEKEITTIIPVNLSRAMEGLEPDNIMLMDRDLLRVYTIRESRFIPQHNVTISGSVQRTGEYERSEGMTIRDLLVKAGGVLPNSYLERADLLRFDFEKETYFNIPVNIGKVLSGDESENRALQDMDSLRLYEMKEVAFTPPHEVAIYGSVQRPGTYTRYTGMRLADLLLASGDVMPGSAEKIEIAKARSEGKIRVIEASLALLNMGDESQNVTLEDGDVVMIRKKSEFFDAPRWVTVSGEVRYPGTYALYGKEDRISTVIERAGGLTRHAHPKGTVLNRKREHFPSDEQRRDVVLTNEIISALNELDYRRQLARNEWLLQKEFGKEERPKIPGAATPVVATSGTPSEAAAIGLAPGVAQAAGEVAGGIVETFERAPGVISSSRRLGEPELLQGERVIFSLFEALKGGEEDIILMDGDTIHIPQRVETVSVVGAVIRPTTIHFSDKTRVDYYIQKSGGYTEDANSKKVLVMRVDGSIVPADKVKNIEEGDIIYVPPKVMSLDIVERIDKVIDVIKFTLVTAASVVVFVTLIGLF